MTIRLSLRQPGWPRPGLAWRPRKLRLVVGTPHRQLV